MNPITFDIRLLGEFRFEPGVGLHCTRCWPWTQAVDGHVSLLELIDIALHHWQNVPH